MCELCSWPAMPGSVLCGPCLEMIGRLLRAHSEDQRSLADIPIFARRTDDDDELDSGGKHNPSAKKFFEKSAGSSC